MLKTYKVDFYSSEVSGDKHNPYIKRDIKIEVEVEAESKSDALMKVAQDYNVYEFIKVERVK